MEQGRKYIEYMKSERKCIVFVFDYVVKEKQKYKSLG
jgi:hypothetical protein